MTETIGMGPGIGGLPARNTAGVAASSATTTTATPIPSNAAGPTWQPWVETHAKAQSALKTQINTALVQFNRDMADAQRLFNTAEAIASQEVQQLRAAAWEAWQKYMQEAEAVHNAIMQPAFTAFQRATQQAHDRSNSLIARAHDAYDLAKDVSLFGRNLATGSDTL